MPSSPEPPYHVALVSDAWVPQVNGVVRTLQTVCTELQARGHRMTPITPDGFRSVACPTYPEIRLAVDAWPRVAQRLDALRPDVIHIATEGPLGLAARLYCARRGLRFTTAYHTKFPEYIEARFHIPASLPYRYLRWFHNRAEAMMVATPSLQRMLTEQGFTRVVPWTRGVDTTLFHPDKRGDLGLPRPIWLYAGRIAIEKNLEAFLTLELQGTKLLVGDGPDKARLEAAFPGAVFVGAQFGEALARYYASSDVFIFPSKTDTFGLVMLEAMASGLPVAAYPVTGPIDVITDPSAGCLSDDLLIAAKTALSLRSEAARAYALHFSWTACATMLEAAFVAASPPRN